MPTGTATARTHSCFCSMPRGRIRRSPPQPSLPPPSHRTMDDAHSSIRSPAALSASQITLDRVDRLSIQIGVARCHGHNEEMLRLTLERAELAPRTSSLRLSAAAAALYANHPKQALQLLNTIDPRDGALVVHRLLAFRLLERRDGGVAPSRPSHRGVEPGDRHAERGTAHAIMAARTRTRSAGTTRAGPRAHRHRAHAANGDLERPRPRALHRRTATILRDTGLGRGVDRARAGGARRYCDIPPGGRARARVVSRATGRRARDDGGASGCRMVARAHGIVSRGRAHCAYARRRGQHQYRLSRRARGARGRARRQRSHRFDR